MKAAVIVRQRGQSQLLIQEVPMPVPGPKDVLVEVYAASVCRADINLRKIPRIILVPLGWAFGFKPMDIPGVEFSGVVHAVGAEVKDFAPGDEVMGTATGLAHGGNAAFIRVPERSAQGVLLKKVKALSFAEAAVVPVGAMTALHLLNALGLKPGQSLLVYGASGSVGSAALQIAQAQGLEVVGVCSGRNLERVRALGLSKVLDYTEPRWYQAAGSFDGVLDAVGKLRGEAKRALRKPRAPFVSIRSPTSEKVSALEYISDLATSGAFRPLMDRGYDLDDIAEAHDYVATGKKQGNVWVRIHPEHLEWE